MCDKLDFNIDGIQLHLVVDRGVGDGCWLVNSLGKVTLSVTDNLGKNTHLIEDLYSVLNSAKVNFLCWGGLLLVLLLDNYSNQNDLIQRSHQYL